MKKGLFKFSDATETPASSNQTPAADADTAAESVAQSEVHAEETAADTAANAAPAAPGPESETKEPAPAADEPVKEKTAWDVLNTRPKVTQVDVPGRGIQPITETHKLFLIQRGYHPESMDDVYLFVGGLTENERIGFMLDCTDTMNKVLSSGPPVEAKPGTIAPPSGSIQGGVVHQAASAEDAAAEAEIVTPPPPPIQHGIVHQVTAGGDDSPVDVPPAVTKSPQAIQGGVVHQAAGPGE